MIKLNGVEKDSIKVRFNASKVKLDFDSDSVSIVEIVDVIEAMGYKVEKYKVRDI